MKGMANGEAIQEVETPGSMGRAGGLSGRLASKGQEDSPHNMVY